MTYLKDPIVLENGKHRLFESMVDFLVIVASVTKAFNETAGRNETYVPGDHADLDSALFPLSIYLPVFGPIEFALKGTTPPRILLGLHSKDRFPTVATQTSLRAVWSNAITPIFITFFENHRPWLAANASSDPNQWPSIWNFARVVRNAMGHGGRLKIDNPNAPPVSWYQLAYGPEHNNRQIIGTDLSPADILILMFEMSDTIDALGCPLAP